MPKKWNLKADGAPLTTYQKRTKFMAAQLFHRILRESFVDYPRGLWKLQIRERLRGRTVYRTKTVTIPLWVIRQDRDHALAYVVHEAAHVLTPGHGHDASYKRVEDHLLKREGYSIKRMKIYAKELYIHGPQKK